jgi:hypothetical protein
VVRRLAFAVVLACTGRLGAAQAPAADADTSAGAPVGVERAPRRGADGRPEVAASRVEGRIRLDGALDEPTWRRAEVAGGFVQSEPRQGEAATERTEVRVAYDDVNLYVAAYLHDAAGARPVVNDVRKDFREEDQDDFEVLLDTFDDRRNAYVFITNAAGARADRQVANEGREVNGSWDAAWDVRTRRVADGWTLEMAIPFRALRYQTGADRAWGINFSRRIRRKNEVAFWAPVPRSFNLYRVSLAGRLVGLSTAGAGRDLRVKPYAAERAVRDVGGARYAESHDVGADIKYGVTAGLTLDVSLNPDFAQAEADEQQVNLTQFSQFFPEKREFFLENSGIFYVGDAARNNRVQLAPTPDEDLLLFFSRRIGLTPDGREIPIAGGARLTGKAGDWRVGALTMQTRESPVAPSENYAVVRLRRNLSTGTDVGVIAMNREVTGWGGLVRDTAARRVRPGYNRVGGADANVRVAGKLDWNSYLVGTATPGVDGGQYAARSSLNWEGNFFHGKGGVLQIGDGFRDDFAFYRRTGVRKWFTDIGVRPRPRALQRRGVREMHPHIVWNYYEDLAGRMVAKDLHSGYTFFMNDGAYAELSVNPAFQRIESPFRINRGVPAIPAGGYSWTTWQLRGQTDPSRPVTAAFTLVEGGLWSGTQRTANTTVTVRPSYRFRVAAGVQRTNATLARPAGWTAEAAPEFTATLWTARGSYSFNTNMFVDGLSQYDPSQKALNTNVRFNLIHHPLSDLYVVYNEQRVSTPESPVPGRSLIVKFTQMLAF